MRGVESTLAVERDDKKVIITFTVTHKTHYGAIEHFDRLCADSRAGHVGFDIETTGVELEVQQ